MPEEKITIKCKQRKNLKSLATLLSGLGFTKIAYSKGMPPAARQTDKMISIH